MDDNANSESFSDSELSTVLVERLSQLGIRTPTEVQTLTMPAALSGIDILIKSKTGSGKTLAFVLPVLHKELLKENNAVETAGNFGTLVLCPTRELVEQVAEEMRRVAKVSPNFKVLQITGGVSIGPQLSSLKHIPNAIIATPGRLLDIVAKSSLSFENLHTVVIDEADRLLDMGFAPQVKQVFDVINKTNAEPQFMLFSATLPRSLDGVISALPRQPKLIEVQSQKPHDAIEQQAWELIDTDKRFYAVAALLTEHQPQSCMIFCNKKSEVDDLHEYLLENKFDVISLHGDMSQEVRDNAIRAFKAKCANILIASDVAARGLDIEAVDLVISAQVSLDADTHIHRIGRTGRADRKGMAVLLFESVQGNHVAKLADATKQHIPKKKMQSLRFHSNRIKHAAFKGIVINAGKKQKINKVDIVGLLTKQGNIPADDLGKIFVSAKSCFIAVKIRSVKPALKCFRGNKIKGKRVSVKAA